jgi:hypothetical protein
MGDQPVAKPPLSHRTTQTQNKRTQTSMPCVGFELTLPVFERAKTVHALYCAATVIGHSLASSAQINIVTSTGVAVQQANQQTIISRQRFGNLL